MGEEEHDIILQKVQESKVSRSVQNSLFISLSHIIEEISVKNLCWMGLTYSYIGIILSHAGDLGPIL